MNRDQVKGRVNDAAGYVQRKAAKLTGTTTQRAKGLLRQAAGKIQKTAGDSREKNEKC